MKKLIIIVLAFFFYIESQAQVPGYKGKKFMLGYTAQMAPNLHNWINNVGSVPFRLHTKHIFSAEYITGRHTSLALEGGFMRYQRVLNIGGETGDLFVNGSMAGASLYIFGNNLAPVGNYFSLNMQQKFFNVDDVRGITDEYMNEDNERITGKFYTTAIGVGFGTKRVFADRIVADFGLGAGLTHNTYTSGNILMHSESRSYLSDFILMRHVINYKIGISGLLF